VSDKDYIPETATIKEAIQHNLPPAMAAESLRIFNRWYSRELKKAREEGRQAGVKEERDRFADDRSDRGFIVFHAPYDFYFDYDQAFARLDELAESGTYGTMVCVVTNQGDALGYSVRPPVADVAKAANRE
jgi:hypothetical protein